MEASLGGRKRSPLRKQSHRCEKFSFVGKSAWRPDHRQTSSHPSGPVKDLWTLPIGLKSHSFVLRERQSHFELWEGEPSPMMGRNGVVSLLRRAEWVEESLGSVVLRRSSCKVPTTHFTSSMLGWAWRGNCVFGGTVTTDQESGVELDVPVMRRCVYSVGGREAERREMPSGTFRRVAREVGRPSDFVEWGRGEDQNLETT